MDLALLETFRTIVREGSFSRAGQKLLRTQPAISLALKRLETDLGVRLIDRSSKQLMLTDAGQLALEYCDRFDGLESELRVVLGELQDLKAGKLTIGVNESAVLYLLKHVTAFRRRHPKMKVELRRSLSSQIPDELLRGSLEMGALSYDPGDERLKLVDIYIDSLVFIVSPEHHLARRRKVSIQELGEEVFVAHNVISPYRRSLVETFQRHRVPLNIEIELPTIDTIRLVVRENLGVTFMPRMCVENELASRELKIIPVEEVHMERKVRLVYPAQRQLSHAAQAFLEMMGETGD